MSVSQITPPDTLLDALHTHSEKTKGRQPIEITAPFSPWCRRGDSNPYVADPH